LLEEELKNKVKETARHISMKDDEVMAIKKRSNEGNENMVLIN